MSWDNNDGLRLKFGTEKTVTNTGGEYRLPGPNRVTEMLIDLTTLTTSPVIQNDVVTFPSGMFIEEVIVDSEVAATGGTSFSLGLIGLDRTTVDSNTKFLSAAPIADHTTAGQKKSYTNGVTGVGAGIGTAATNPGYITALAAGTYTAGKIRVRIYWHGYTTITK